MRAINLLPRDDARRGGPQKNQWIVLVPVVDRVLHGGAVLGDVPLGSGTVKDKQAELATFRTSCTRSRLPTPRSRVKTQTALAADKQARVTALSRRSRGASPGTASSASSRSCCRTTSGSATISAKAPVPSSTAAAPAPAAPGTTVAATGFTIDGYTYSHPAVARLLSRLAVVPDLVNVQLQQSTLTKVGNAQAVALHHRRRRPAAGSRTVKKGLPQPVVIALIVARLPRARRPAAGSCSSARSMRRRPTSTTQIADTNSAIDAAARARRSRRRRAPRSASPISTG